MSTPDPTNPPYQPARLHPVAGVCAIIFPGLGHIVRGEVSRGILAGVSVLSLFFGGVLIGGIDVIDAREDRVWFLGQAIVGPVAFATNAVHQSQFKAYGRSTTESNKVILRSGRPDEYREYSEADSRWNWVRVTPEELGVKGPPNRKSVAKVNEIGTLYATLAGMVNLIVILDALIMTPRRRRAEVVSEPDPSAAEPEAQPTAGGAA